MELTDRRSIQRMHRIQHIETLLKKIKETDDRTLDFEEFEFQMAEYFGISIRVARDYIKTAKWRVKW